MAGSMLSSLSSISSLVGQGIKGLAGGIQSYQSAKQLKKLWNSRPELGVTEGERANDLLYKQMASSTELPGQSRYEDKLGQAYSEGVYDLQRTSNSSLGATQGAVDLAGKKMEAIRDLSGMFAEFKQQRMDALAGWNREKSNLETQRWDINTFQPWNIKMNQASGNMQAGTDAVGSAFDGYFGIANDFIGTQNYMEMMKSMYPNFGGGQGVQNPSNPIMQGNPYNPQANLNKTLTGQRPQITFPGTPTEEDYLSQR